MEEKTVSIRLLNFLRNVSKMWNSLQKKILFPNSSTKSQKTAAWSCMVSKKPWRLCWLESLTFWSATKALKWREFRPKTKKQAVIYHFFIIKELNVIFVKPEDEQKDSNFKDGEQELEKVESDVLSEWLAEHYNEFGAKLQFITNKSAEGVQFIKGFSGLGGFLR